MPYSETDDNLPENVKKMSPKAKKAWVKIYNSTHARCVADEGDDCEGQAMRVANAMAKRMEMGMEEEVLYVNLAQLANGRSFDAMVPGTFVDMLGRTVTFKKTELEKYVENTKGAIAATSTESGEVVGLPIDAKGHDKGDGAGWIVDVTLEGGKVRLVPKWTEIGLELITKGIRRFFSPTIDTANKVILGGTLTNWPATRDKGGRILLRPIELENPDLLAIDEHSEFAKVKVSLDEQLSAIRDKFYSDFRPDVNKQAIPIDDQPYIVNIFPDRVIVRSGPKYFSVPYSQEEDGDMTFAGKEDWKEVRQSWVEAAMARMVQAWEQVIGGVTAGTELASGEEAELEDFDSSAWDAGKATSGKTYEQQKGLHLLDLNGYPGQEGDPVIGLLYLPYRYSAEGNPNKNAIRAIGAGARSMAAIKKPGDVPQAYFDARMKSAANRVLTLWKAAFGGNAPEAVFKLAGRSRPAESSLQENQEVITMEITKEELTATIASEVRAALGADLKASLAELMGLKPEGEDGKPAAGFDVLAFLEMQGVGEQFQGEVKAAMLDLYEQTKAGAAREAAILIDGIRREAHVSEFASRVVSGTEETPRGLAVPVEDLKKFLLSLNPDQAAFIQPLLERVVDGTGVVEFTEMGHGKKQSGVTPLPEYLAEKLDAGELKLADLSDPILGLGDVSQFDLTKWQKA